MKKRNTTLLMLTLFILFVGVNNANSQCRLQLIHNSPDTSLKTVDVWINGVKILDDANYRTASTFATHPSGTFDVTIASANSTNDTTPAFIRKKFLAIPFDSGKTYVTFVNGVIDTTKYAVNPDGKDRSLNLVRIDSFPETTTTGQVSFSFANGSIDAPTYDFNEIGLPNLNKIGEDLSYGGISFNTSLPIGNTMFNLTSADSLTVNGVYRYLTNTTVSGKAGMIFTSGVSNKVANPLSALPFGIFVAFTDGSVKELTQLFSHIQVVHNSADITCDSVDVYVNGQKTLPNFKFRHATPFIPLTPLLSYTFAIANAGSANVSEAFSTATSVLDSSKAYYAIATGLKDVTGYAVNPNGKDRSFKIALYPNARMAAQISKNVDLLYFHGVTDLQKTTIRGISQVQFLSKDDSYGDFHGYGIHSGQENQRFDVSDAAVDTILTECFAQLIDHKGEAGLVFASGFKSKANNKNGPSAFIFIAWPNGNLDTMTSRFPIGIKETIDSKIPLSIAPNPANDELNISYTLNQQAETYIEVFDITGKRIFSQTEFGFNGNNKVAINISTFKSGMYFIQIKSLNQVASQKFSVLH